MSDLPVDTSDIYSQFGVSPNDYTYDPSTNTIKRKELALPTELPVDPMTGSPIYADSAQANVAPDWIKKLTGTGGEERYQTWPERMVRSGAALPADVYEGRVPVESSAGYPGSVEPRAIQMEPNVVGKALGIGNFTIPDANSEIGRAQDVAGMAGMSSVPLAPKGALGAIGGKFYSTLENTITGSKVQKATPEQWQSYLKNQLGVKPEELEFSLSNLPEGQITKEQLAAHVADNGIKLGEVWKGDISDPLVSYLHESYGPATKHIQTSADIADAKRFNANFRESVKGLSDEEILKAARKSEEYEKFGDTKYSSYQLPGGENYRELLMTLPEKKVDKLPSDWSVRQEPDGGYYVYNSEGRLVRGGDTRAQAISNSLYEAQEGKYNTEVLTPTAYRSSHWNEPNVLAHIRMNDRDIPGVGKTLHVEEIQSDWAQAHRKQDIVRNNAVDNNFLKTTLDMEKMGHLKIECE